MSTNLLLNSLQPSTQPLNLFERWLYGLINSIIVGGATAVVSWGGLAIAHAAGDVQVPAMNWHIIGIIFLSGAGSKLFLYLSQGLPNIDSPSTPAQPSKQTEN